MPVDATLPYDDPNIFAKKYCGGKFRTAVYEISEWALAFHDINPQAPIHILVIPQGAYVGWDDFSAHGSKPRLPVSSARLAMSHANGSGGAGYRLLANAGINSHQEVPHLHVHLFGGKALGPMLVR
ncbi:MAG: HIT domain-containing protein [Rhodospirillaceae bacterium]|nr:HIT domain-containing protein [Rhodospirillaceae bacterium]